MFPNILMAVASRLRREELVAYRKHHLLVSMTKSETFCLRLLVLSLPQILFVELPSITQEDPLGNLPFPISPRTTQANLYQYLEIGLHYRLHYKVESVRSKREGL